MTQAPRFQKNVEDFVCEHCKEAVKGSGYTNHCPKCLWSKHVDINPGDRSSTCLGMMQPIAVEGGPHEYRLLHLCAKCGLKKRNVVGSDDDMEAVLALAGRRT